jgi:hypothetical protein
MDKIINTLKGLWEDLKPTLLQWIWPFAVYKRNPDGTIKINPKTKEKEINYLGTVIARLLSLVTAVWGTSEVLGIPVATWVFNLLKLFGLE